MAGCHVGAMEARATVTRHRLWTCVTFQLGCPASQSESVQPWRGGCRLTLIMSPAHVKDDETPREAMQGFATFFMRDKERWVFRFVLSARIYAGFRTQSLENYYFSNIYTQSS